MSSHERMADPYIQKNTTWFGLVWFDSFRGLALKKCLELLIYSLNVLSVDSKMFGKLYDMRVR